MKVSIKKISEITGFSPATISNALNNKKGVNKDTAETIFKVARKLGYFSDTKMTHIKFVSIKKHGKVVGDTPFFHSLIEGVEKESRIAGLDTIICNLNVGDSDYDDRLGEILSDSSCGILLLATELDNKDMERFKSALGPLVMIDNWADSMHFNSVMISNADSMSNAVSLLVQKGHKKIGYLKGSVPIKNFYDRYHGYQRAMQDYHLSVNPDFCVPLEPTMEGSYRDMTAYLAGSPKLLTAYLADNDIIAFGAMKALKEYGSHLPDDISIIGFDDLPFCEISSPTLSTIKVPKQQLGRTAVRRLIEIASDKQSIPLKIQVSTEMICRESVRNV